MSALTWTRGESPVLKQVVRAFRAREPSGGGWGLRRVGMVQPVPQRHNLIGNCDAGDTGKVKWPHGPDNRGQIGPARNLAGQTGRPPVIIAGRRIIADVRRSRTRGQHKGQDLIFRRRHTMRKAGPDQCDGQGDQQQGPVKAHEDGVPHGQPVTPKRPTPSIGHDRAAGMGTCLGRAGAKHCPETCQRTVTRCPPSFLSSTATTTLS